MKNIEKLKIELEDMEEKYNKLSAFISSDEYTTIPIGEQTHLEMQIRAMGSYIIVLQLRLEEKE